MDRLNYIEHLLLNTFDSLGIYDMDKHAYVYLSPGTKEVFGKPVRELLHNPNAILETIDVQDRASFTEGLQPQNFIEGKLNLRYRINTKTGETKYVLDKRMLVMDANGKPSMIESMVFDLSKGESAETHVNELIKGLKELQHALMSSSIVSITDAKGIIIYANDNFTKISGFPIQDLVGKNHNIINSGFHPKSFFKDMWSTIAKGQIWRGDIRNKMNGGGYYWVDSYIVPFMDVQGKPYQYLSIRNDITARMKYLSELESTKQNLEKNVQDRTHELQIANRNLQEFAYSVSHDLKAPLRHIKVFGEYLKDGMSDEVDGKSLQYLQNILGSAEKMSLLIEGLLQFSRIGQHMMNFQLVDTQKLVSKQVELLKTLWTANHMVFTCDNLPKIFADEVLIGQVFDNLLSNAFKYSSKKSESKVHLGYRDGGSYHEFFIRDNGAGFDMRYANKLFGTFQRLHTANEFEGTGIGLANARRVVERHDGKIWAESKLNEGSIFYFTISKQIHDVATKDTFG